MTLKRFWNHKQSRDWFFSSGKIRQGLFQQRAYWEIVHLPWAREFMALPDCSSHHWKSCQSMLPIVGYFKALFQSHRKNIFMIEENTILPSIDFWRVEQFKRCYIWKKYQKLCRILKLFNKSLEVLCHAK